MADESGGGATADTAPRLGSRIVATWVELTIAGLVGGIVGTTVGGPPGLVVYYATTLLSVAILLYNVNELVQRSVSQWTEKERTRGEKERTRAEG